jgi:16S rRNA A1518/A1519 N6-dimethyltransferase RsmA/KsgA/DIM1 with predicted DNA glycosylase/AP lyase activity
MNNDWNFIFEKYALKIKSPDGRETFESSSELCNRIINYADIKLSDTIIDMRSGWGNVTNKLSPLAKKVIGIEPNKKI